MKILLTGANGFIGSAVMERLLTGGHHIVACGRHRANLPATDRVTFVRLDMNHSLDSGDWQPLLAGVDAVINCAGVLREPRAGAFERIHYTAPLALARACSTTGVKRFIQISALGDPADGEFIASKHRLDEALPTLGLAVWILRPSVVLSLRGSYGGTSTLRAAAALPGVLLLPADGRQQIQPVLLEDLACIVERALTTPAGHAAPLDAVGPEVMTLRDYLVAIRAWLKLPPPRVVIRLPAALVSGVARVCDLLRAGPMDIALWRMLQRGNTAQAGAQDRLEQTLGIRPASVTAALGRNASFVQDRWHARLYLLHGLAWLALVVIWLLSAVSGFTAVPVDYAPLLSAIGFAPGWHVGAVMAASSINLALGVLLALRRWIRPVLVLMLLSVLAYTLALGLLVPAQWLDITGGLVKNLAIMVLIAICLVLEDGR